MRIAFYDTHSFEKEAFERANKEFAFQLTYLEPRLTETTAVLVKGHDCVCAFTNDHLSPLVLKTLKDSGCRLIALRSAGFNHVDLTAAKKLNMSVVRVPEYSPYAVAEHVLAMVLTLNRKTHRAYNRVREGNFSLNGLVGFDLHGKTVGVIGTGRIGSELTKILTGFGCRVLTHDIHCNEKLSLETHCSYVPLETVLKESEIISLNVPLTSETRHFIGAEQFAMMKEGVMLINTGRGALIDTKALIKSLKSGHIGSAGLDVYEEEEGVFFHDFSGKIISDDVLARLLTFPNVLITGHQAFLTYEALNNIATTTLMNIHEFEQGKNLTNEVSLSS